LNLAATFVRIEDMKATELALNENESG